MLDGQHWLEMEDVWRAGKLLMNISIPEMCFFEGPHSTSFGLSYEGFGGNIVLFERPPFELLFVSTTSNAPLRALLTGRFCLIAFEPFRLTGDAACLVIRHQRLSGVETSRDSPFLLFDCFRFVTGSICCVPNTNAFSEVELRFCVLLFVACVGATDWVDFGSSTGEWRKTEGDGMVMVSAIKRQGFS